MTSFKFALQGALAAGILLVGQSALAQATKNVFNGPTQYLGGYGTSITNWTATFDTAGGAQKLSLDVAMGSEFVKDDGFWLVLNNGGNPKGIVNELAILYGDIKNNKITAYKYNGDNSPNSFDDPSAYLGTYNNVFTSGNNAFSFNLDVTSLNSLNLPNWKGTSFGNDVGIWYHNTDLLTATYDADGRITGFGGGFGYYDTDKQTTQGYCADGKPVGADGKCGQSGGSSSGGQVPEPASMALFGLGLAGLGFARRRRA